MLKKTLFNSVIYRGTLGSIYGIVVGLILGMLIWALMQISSAIISPALQRPATGSVPLLEFYLTLSMGSAAIIGGVFGALTALKEDKKNK